MKCPNCGNELMQGALFCTFCGNRIPETVNTAESQTSVPVQEESAENVQPQEAAENAQPQEAAPEAATENTQSQEVAQEAAAENAQPQEAVQEAAAENTQQAVPEAGTENVQPAPEIPEAEVYGDQPVVENKKKKMTTRLIGVAAVAIVVAAAGFIGYKAVNALNPKLDKQLLYAKSGKLYFMNNVSKEKDPVEIYRVHDDASFDITYSRDEKYAFFLTGSSDKNRLFRVNLQKLSDNESKNEKYIEEIDSGVSNYAVMASDKVLYYRDRNSDYGYELNYYDGKDTKEIDNNVMTQHHSGNTVYYLRENNDDDNYDLYSYNLKSGKSSDMGEVNYVQDYTENEILYSVNNGETYDIYKAKAGSKGTKLVSDVQSDWSGSLDSGTLLYTRERKESKPYYDFVNDPDAKSDASIQEPQQSDYVTEVDPEDIMDGWAYDEYCTDKDEFEYDYVSSSWDGIDYNGKYLSQSIYYYGEEYYYDSDTYKFYQYDSEGYSEAYDAYYEVNERNELRDNLKNMTYDMKSYDIYSYSSKGGEKKLVESAYLVDYNSQNQIVLYRKAQDLGDEKVCSLNDLYSASDVENYLDEYDVESDLYVNVNGKETDTKMTSAVLNVSPDGKTVMIIDKSADEYELIAYSKKGDGLDKIGTVEKSFCNGSWYDGDYYYFDTDNNFYVYSGGKSKKIAKDVATVALADDGNKLTYDNSSSGATDLKIVKGEESIGKIRDVSVYNTTYIDSKCIVYLTNDGDLKVYDGEDSRKIDRDVSNYRMPEDHTKATFESWNY